MTGPNPETPTKTGPGIGDIFAGMTMAFGIMAALREADATGKGQFVEVSMYDAMISLCERMIYLHDFTGEVPEPEGNAHPFLAPFGLFPASDGHIALGIVDDAFWRRLVDIMGKPELGQDPRFANRAQRGQNAEQVERLVTAWTSERTKAELTGLLGGQVPFGPLNTVADIFADPHVAARGMLEKVPSPEPGQAPWTVAANPLRFAAHGHGALAAPPRLGADNAMLTGLAPPAPMDPADIRALRDAFGRFATGVTVVTTCQADGTPRGFTANSFTSVSLDPPLLLVCIGKRALSCDTFAACDHFVVNILADDQKEISGLFASQSADKFEIADWHPNAQGMAVLDGALTSFSCAQHKLVDAGDHLILIGRVLDFETGEGQPLGYYKGAYFDVGVDRALTDAAASGGGTLGAVLECEDRLLLAEGPSGAITVPTAPASDNSVDGLIIGLGDRGLFPELTDLYAVYQITPTGTQRIIYHGTVQGEAPEGLRFFDLNALPLDRVEDEAERAMLRRYAQENRHGSFGIYHGTEVEGVVHTLAGHRTYRI
jgi:flavin reductase (DIM6/NTAB) family NADH-FMN oxidoreductase RutF|nr:CoA transferase [Aestuariivita sp.]